MRPAPVRVRQDEGSAESRALYRYSQGRKCLVGDELDQRRCPKARGSRLYMVDLEVF